MIEWLKLNWLTILFGITSFIEGIWIYIISTRKKSVSYFNKHYQIIGENIKKFDKLVITYDGVELTSFAITTLSFWNSGTETLRNNDLPKVSPLSITINKDNSFLEGPIIIKQSNVANNISLNMSADKKLVLINFDFIDKNDGFIVKLYHTGISKDSIFVSGNIIGVKKINYFQPNINNFYISYVNWKNQKKSIFLFYLKQFVSHLGFIGIWVFFISLYGTKTYSLDLLLNRLVLSLSIILVLFLFLIIATFSSIKNTPAFIIEDNINK